MILVPLISTAIREGVKAESLERYYAGYEYGAPDTFGISARIFTINPNVPEGNFLAQRICILISADNAYWIQVGYDKNISQGHGNPCYYYEVYDENGWRLIYPPIRGPQPSSTYIYYISGASGTHWLIGICDITGESILSTTVETVPFASQELEAFSEATTESISIDGTHFSQSKYFHREPPYVLWDQHVAEIYPSNAPYSIQVVSDHEFYASGGG